MSFADKNQQRRLERSGKARLLQMPVVILILGGLLFGSAGRWDWRGAWAFLGLFLLMAVVAATWVVRYNPELLNERGRIAENTKSWDKIILALYVLLMLGMLVTAGLDVRFGWSVMPSGWQILGGAALTLAMLFVGWVAVSNAYLSATVRIQEDRGQVVVSTGPYRFVRHPMYAADLLFFWSIPLLLGSWWALIPGGLNMVVFIVRTALEDRTLQSELVGYAEYARRVRYRLIPGVW